jgi:hypothetical protein
MREKVGKLFLLIIVLGFAQIVTAQTLNFSRPTVTAVLLKDTPFYHQKVYEDSDYLFVYRLYGRAEYTPGFFVYGKKPKKWIEIKELSAEHAKLGRYFPFLPKEEKDKKAGMKELVRNPRLPLLSVTWDYSSLKNFDCADLPLRTSGSISFPDKIEYDKDKFCTNIQKACINHRFYSAFMNIGAKPKLQRWISCFKTTNFLLAKVPVTGLAFWQTKNQKY